MNVAESWIKWLSQQPVTLPLRLELTEEHRAAIASRVFTPEELASYQKGPDEQVGFGYVSLTSILDQSQRSSFLERRSHSLTHIRPSPRRSIVILALVNSGFALSRHQRWVFVSLASNRFVCLLASRREGGCVKLCERPIAHVLPP